MGRKSFLFVCTGNCFRSQMAEGLMQHIAGDRCEVRSAGSHPAGYVHPLAVAVMGEIGIDISEQESKGLEEFADREFDYVVTLCGHAQAACPMLHGRVDTLHWPVEDPTRAAANDKEAEDAARRVREELRERLTELLGEAGRRWTL